MLRTSKFLVAFLQESNQDKFNHAVLSVEEDRGPKCIYDLKTLTGEIEIDKRERSEKYCNQLDNFTSQYEMINKL